jgi:PTS system mannose-specific IID component
MLHYNCHPFLTPLAAGIFLHCESAIAAGLFPESVLVGIKDSVTNTFSALGDSLFSASLLVSWAFVAAILVVMGQGAAMMCMTAALLLALQAFKLATFILGLRYGFAVLLRLMQWNAINWGVALKRVNAVLLCVLAVWIFQPWRNPGLWGILVCVLAPAAWTVWRLSFPRCALTVALAALWVEAVVRGWHGV